MGKTTRANSKKAAPASVTPAKTAEPLFQLDTAGDSSVRNSLQHAFSAGPNPAAARLRRGTAFNKPLKSDQILAARSAEPALRGRVIPSLEIEKKKDKVRRTHIDRETKERLKRITGRDGSGSGLWSVKSGGAKEEALTEAVRQAGGYDAWERKMEEIDENDDESLKKLILANTTRHTPKAPSTLHEHPLLSSGGGPLAIPLPHPGMSYNPVHTHHQALLANALTHYTAVEEREERAVPIKEAMDGIFNSVKGREPWEIYEEEVGSGEEDAGAEIEDPEAVELRLRKKQPKRKTRQQRNNKLRIAAEAIALAQRRASKARVASVVTAPSVIAAINDSEALSVAEKAAAIKLRKAQIARQGLTRLRSGPSRVPDASITYQLGEELADNLRTLTPEGNLWRDWVGSGMRRGKVPVERANENKKGGKRGGRGKDKGSKVRYFFKFKLKRLLN
ncbi:nucleolar protein 53, partial [Phenoliferia sp. Uapishka_3]